MLEKSETTILLKNDKDETDPKTQKTQTKHKIANRQSPHTLRNDLSERRKIKIVVVKHGIYHLIARRHRHRQAKKIVFFDTAYNERCFTESVFVEKYIFFDSENIYIYIIIF